MISVIIPSLDRPQRLISCLTSLQKYSKGSVEVVVILDGEDKSSLEAVTDFATKGVTIPITVRILKDHPTPIEKWNHGAKHSKGGWIMLAADDIVFTQEWDIVSLATPNHGFLALRDTVQLDRWFEPHYMATRGWLKQFNGGVLACPHYKHWCPDTEIAQRAHRAGHYKVSEAIIPHNHIIWGTAPNDATYDRAKPYHNTDLKLFNERMSKSFPNDYEGYL